jgi:hypothetical protein
LRTWVGLRGRVRVRVVMVRARVRGVRAEVREG